MSYDAATEMVRHAFVAQYGYSPDLVDNWLKFIIEEERERIIALLESQSLLEDACKESPEACSCHLLIPTVQFIKLIRKQDAQH